MVNLTRIYTRTGDDGTTGLVDGSRTAKHSLRIAAIGEVDELNSALGVAAAWTLRRHPGLMLAALMVGTLFAYLNYRSPKRRIIFVVISLIVPIIGMVLHARMAGIGMFLQAPSVLAAIIGMFFQARVAITGMFLQARMAIIGMLFRAGWRSSACSSGPGWRPSAGSSRPG